jgi:predicted acetyltransferase
VGSTNARISGLVVGPGAHCFFIAVDGERAGFVLIDRHGTLPATEYNVAEFFVLRNSKAVASVGARRR